MKYVVEVIHQVTETYAVEADSREQAWQRVVDAHPLTDDPDTVRLTRTHHGRREVWAIKRQVDDVPLPEGPPALRLTSGDCAGCGTPLETCMAHVPFRCCGLCHHPGGSPL